MFFIIAPLAVILPLFIAYLFFRIVFGLVALPLRAAPVATLVVLIALVVIGRMSPSPDIPSPEAQRATAMKAGSFDCKATLKTDDTFTDHDVWSYCSGALSEAGWQALVDARLAKGWDDLARSEAADKAAYAAQQRGFTDMGRRAATGR